MTKKPRTRLMIVRHGETLFNKEFRLAGVTDVPLSADGVAQVVSLRPEIDRRPVDMVFTSPLKRALRTCRILTQGRSLPFRIDPMLAERDYGAWEGKTFQQILSEQPDGGESLMYGPFVAKFASGETDEAFIARVREVFFNRLLMIGEHKNILVVGHAGFFMTMLAVAFGLNPKTDFATFRLDNASLTVIDWYDGIPHVHFVNRIFRAP